MKKIAYYITAHGYGHGARSCDILNALRIIDCQIPIIVKTDLPVEFMQSRLAPNIELRCGAFDIGLIQKDSIRVDLEASLEALSALYEREEVLIRQEVDFFLREEIGVVVADIPAIPLAAAQRAQLPNIATGNFGWDWIYDEFVQYNPLWKTYADKIRAVYRSTDLLLRQPFAESMDAFPRQIDLPLLAKPGIARRDEIARLTRANAQAKWVLLSFTSLDLDRDALDALTQWKAYEFFSVDPLDWPESTVHCISRSRMSFADILASMDMIVTKPGFGIISECIANDKPIIYSDRADFREYRVLVNYIERYCRHAFIPNADLYAGQLGRALWQIETAPLPHEKIAAGGAEIAAAQILKML